MSVTVLEDLPNELWVELFVYFTWAELDSTWLYWNLNGRIRTLALAAHSRVAFALSPTSLTTHLQYAHYFEHDHPRMANRIASLVLDDAILAGEIVTRWLHQGPSFFPRLRRCTIHFDLVGRCVRASIVRVIQQCTSTLRHLVFYFKTFEMHDRLWRRLITQGIGVHTMQLIVIEDEEVLGQSDSGRDYAGTLPQPLVFANTVRLRLSLQHSCDLLWLLSGDTLPRLEHLHVTQEKLYKGPYRLEQPSCLPLRAEDFDVSPAEGASVRTLQLRQVPMDVVMTLVTHLESIRHLESFVLTDCSVEDRAALRTFRNCITSRFTRLRRLQFAFSLPVETILDEVDLDWFHLGHDAVHQHVDKVLLLHTSPYIFHHQRHLYNHVCEQTPTSNATTEHLQWTVDCDPSSIDATLTHLQRVHSLTLYVDIQAISFTTLAWSAVLPRLRSLQLSFDYNPLHGPHRFGRPVTPMGHRHAILEQLRQCAPALEYLTLWWHDVKILLAHFALPWPSVRELHVRVETGKENIPSASLIGQLPTNWPFPQLRYLSFGSRRFRLDPPDVLAEWILSWLDGLVSASSNFTILHVNRCCPYYRSLRRDARETLTALLEKHVASNGGKRSPSKIIIDPNEEVVVWL